ncbi:hypothetical protein SEA_TOKKI_55 [Arthrobacter phage Tokki]|nr:hypothetical protein SEA_TOKKI_55 [Arthrobacter phage Tokki]
MIEVQKSLALQVSVRTGLKEDTCLDLILSGWTFEQRDKSAPDRWISPFGSLTIPK